MTLLAVINEGNMNIFIEFQTYFCLDSQTALLNSGEGKSKGIFREQIEDKVGVCTKEDPRECAQEKERKSTVNEWVRDEGQGKKTRLGENKRDENQGMFSCYKL